MKLKLIALSAFLSVSGAFAGTDGVIQAPRGCADLAGRYTGVGCEGTLKERASFELKQLGCEVLILLDREPSIPMVFHLAATEKQEIDFDPNAHTEEAAVKMTREARWLENRTKLNLRIVASERVKERGGEARSSTARINLALSRLPDGNLQVEGTEASVDVGGSVSVTAQGVCTYRPETAR